MFPRTAIGSKRGPADPFSRPIKGGGIPACWDQSTSVPMAQGKRWVFTENNPVDVLQDKWAHWPDVEYGICQVEQGAVGTLHYQGFVRFTKNKRLGAVKILLPRAHWAVARGTDEDNERYCSKEEGRVRGPYRIGELRERHQGKRTDWEKLHEDIKAQVDERELAERHFRLVAMYPAGIEKVRRLITPDRDYKTDLICICGVPRRGKSELVRELADGNIYEKPTGDNWWDGYARERVAHLDEFDGYVPLSTLLILADASAKPLVPIKGGYVPFRSHAIMITSNLKPDQWYTNKTDLQQRALYRRITLYIWRGETEEQDKCLVAPPEGFQNALDF